MINAPGKSTVLYNDHGGSRQCRVYHSNSTKGTVAMNKGLSTGRLDSYESNVVESQMKRLVGNVQSGMDQHLAIGETNVPTFGSQTVT